MNVAQYLPLVVLLALGYLLLIRPARRRAHDVSTLQSALSVGDRVMLSSGIFGAVTSLVDEEAGVEVASGVVLRVHRAAIAKIVRDEPADDYPVSPAESQEAPARSDEPDDPTNRGVS